MSELLYNRSKAVAALNHIDGFEPMEFARVIDPRIRCECVSCYPEITDETCCCAWKFTLAPQAE